MTTLPDLLRKLRAFDRICEERKDIKKHKKDRTSRKYEFIIEEDERRALKKVIALVKTCI